MDAGSTDRFAQQNLQIPEHASNRTLPIWLFFMLVYLSEIGLLLVALMLFWLLPYLLNLNLTLPTCNRCSMLDLMDKCAELTNLTLLRGKYTSKKSSILRILGQNASWSEASNKQHGSLCKRLKA